MASTQTNQPKQPIQTPPPAQARNGTLETGNEPHKALHTRMDAIEAKFDELRSWVMSRA